MSFFSWFHPSQGGKRPPFPVPGLPLPVIERPVFVALILVSLAALALRLHALGEAHLWWDEFVTLSRAALPPASLWNSLANQAPNDGWLDSNPPLLHFLTHGLLAFGVHDSWIKVPSAVFGAGAVLAVGLLGATLFGRTAGLASALVLTLNLFHIHYSRELRPYSLFLFCALWSLWLLLKARASGRPRHWALYALCVAAMFYSSYLAAATLAGQGLFVLVDWLASRRAAPGAGRAYLFGFCASCLAALALYLPWLPGHMYHLRMIQGLSTGMGAPGLDPASLLKEYVAQGLQADLPLAFVALALLAGLAMAAYRNWRGALLFVLWVGMSLAVTVVARFVGQIPARYLVCAVVLVAVAGGVLADALAGLLPRFVPASARAGAALALALLVGLPGLLVYPAFCRPSFTEIEALCSWLRDNRDNVDALIFHRNHHQKVTTAWLVPDDLYQRLGDSPAAPYLRCYLVSEKDAVARTPEIVRFNDLTVHRQGLLRQAPVVLDRPYREDFSSLRFYEDAADWRNAGPDTDRRDLAPFDPSRKGFAVYRFQSPAEGFPQGIALSCRLRLERTARVAPPDASVRIVLGVAGQPPVLDRVVTQADFPPADSGDQNLALRFPLPEPVVQGQEVELRFELEPGTRHGALSLCDFSLEWPGGVVLSGGLEKRFANLAAAGALRTWTPDAMRLAERSVYAFSLDDDRAAGCLALGLQNANARREFENVWPGLAPVAVWTDSRGAPAVALYDPALDHAWLPPGKRVLYLGDAAAVVKLEGLTASARVHLGREASTLDTDLPAKARLRAQAGQPVRVRLQMTGPDQALDQAYLAENLNADYDGFSPCLRCRTGDGCFATYAFTLPWPAKRVEIVYHPFLSSLSPKPNELAFSLSTDGNAYRRIAVFSGPRLLDWDGGGRMIARTTLDKPSRLVYVRLEMTSEESILRVSPLEPFTLEFELEGSWELPVAPGRAPFVPLEQGPPRARMFFFPARTPR